MLESKKLSEIIEDVFNAMPPGAKQLPDEIKQHLRAELYRGLSQLDVVTREEFDIQVKVLAKTRAKLEQLESRLAEQNK